jgi:uncharacterized protein YkwD
VADPKNATTGETRAEATPDTPKKTEEPKKVESSSDATVNKGTGQENALAFVPADASLVLGYDGGKLAKLRPDLVAMLKDAVLGNAKQYLSDPQRDVGLEFADFYHQVIVAIHMDPLKAFAAGPNAKPDFQTLIIKSKVPFDPKKVQSTLPKAQQQKVKDKVTFQIQHEEFSTAYMPSDSVLILTSLDGERLDALVAADGTKPMLPPEALTLIDQAKKAPVWLAIPFSEQIKGLLGGLAQQAQGVPEPLKPVVKAATSTQAAGLWLNADAANLKLSLGVNCANEADAKLIASTLQALWNAQKAQVNKQVQDGLKDAKLPADLVTIIKNVLDSVQAVPTQTVAELSVQVDLKAVEGLSKQVAENPLVFLGSLQQAMGKFNQPKFEVAAPEKQLLDLVNKEREAQELPKLVINPTLFKVAREHAKQMAKINATDDEIDGKDTGKRLEAAEYKFEQAIALMAFAPNVNPPAVINVWKNNVASKAVILEKKYTEVGIGFAMSANNQVFVSMVFAAPAK